MTPLDCLLVADDLTGACDAAVHFASRGLATAVPLAPGADVAESRVLAISTESRDLEPPEIQRALAAVAAAYPPAAARIFKKIDSTLRGNTAHEIEAALAAFGCDAAVVCPAYPQLGRVVEQGLLRVTSTPGFTPIDVAAHLPQPCAHTHPEGISALLRQGARVVSVDAACPPDLDAIAGVVFPLGRRILWAGSAGLASALARRLGATGTSTPIPVNHGPVLFCIGSDHPVTLEQQAALLAARPSVLASGRPSIHTALARGEHVVLRIPRGHITASEIWNLIAGAPAAAIVLSGGDTASLVCQAASVRHIRLCDEIVSGVPRGVLHRGEFDGISVVTKSGGFGDRAALIQIADYFACPK